MDCRRRAPLGKVLLTDVMGSRYRDRNGLKYFVKAMKWFIIEVSVDIPYPNGTDGAFT